MRADERERCRTRGGESRRPARGGDPAERGRTAALGRTADWNTLAWARYRAGDDGGSRLALEESQGRGGLTSDHYLRALLLHRQGDDDGALRSYGVAVRATRDTDYWADLATLDELRMFRAETREALGIASGVR